jgi:Protein of unknown function (DUF3572)
MAPMVNKMRPDTGLETTITYEEVPLLFLAFLMADDDRRDHFMAESGLAVDELRERLEEPHFKSFLLDYALSDEKLIIAFASEHGVDPQVILKARRKFPGAGFEM